MSSWALKLQFGKDAFTISVEPQADLRTFQLAVEEATGVFVRHQKLIFKGKVLEGDGISLADLRLKNGAKVMLMSSSGGLQTGGQRAAQEVATQKAKRTQARLAGGGPRGCDTLQKATPASAAATLQARASGWAKTGVVSLTGEKINCVPDVVWSTGAAAKVVDLSDNGLKAVSNNLGLLSNLQRLRLAGNQLDSSLGFGTGSWQALVAMTHLVQLDLSRNLLTELPSCIGDCKALKVLAVSSNKIAVLPEELGQLSELQELDASSNCIEELPDSLGSMTNAKFLRFGGNQLKQLPITLANLQQLAVLSVPSNRLAEVPATILVGCTSLRSLDIHDNPVTIQQLRESEGWEVFDARRKAACDKLIDSRVLSGPKNFDEGADEQQWNRWG